MEPLSDLWTFFIVLVAASSVACELASVSSTSLVPPTISSSDPTSVRSESASPYAECDDESFADFVAKEASTSMVGGDISHSPTPNPSHSSSQQSANSDIHALLNHLHQQSPGPSTERASPGPLTALISQFGVTASCPPTPVQLPEGAISAVRAYIILLLQCNTIVCVQESISNN